MNNYELAEIVEIGRAQDVILGGLKISDEEDDGVGQPRRQPFSQEDE
jgi:hypothetical protein